MTNKTLWHYNALDCCVTFEVAQQLIPKANKAYDMSMRMHGPALDMMLRGILVDTNYRNQVMEELRTARKRVKHVLDTLAQAVWDQPLNHNSPQQLRKFFYDVMRLPRQKSYNRTYGERRETTNRDALEKLQGFRTAKPIINAILRLREIDKSLSVLRSGIDSDQRMRTSYNVCGTETWRWSSSENVFGTGSNLQNITGRLRRIFVARPGWKLAYIDLEQAESRAVAYLSGDRSYIKACESGDLHTTVATMVWPELAWTGKAAEDRKVADQIFYREFSYRDMAKRGGHGTNYYGTPRTMASFLKVETRVMERFQQAYFKAFPGIRKWHHAVARELQTTRQLTTPFGLTRTFWGRPNDDNTLREAIAFVPQSTIACYLNEAMWRVWNLYTPRVRLLGQVHDAILIEYQEGDKEAVRDVQGWMSFAHKIHGRPMSIPTDVAVGWNWDYANDVNPDGLIKGIIDDRERQHYPPASILDRWVC